MNDDNQFAVGFMEKPYMIIKADSGGIKFSITILNRRGTYYYFHLLKKECSHLPAYTFKLGDNGALMDPHNDREIRRFKIHNFYNQSTHNFWLTWFNDEICFGKVNEPALMRYPEINTNSDKMIGFVKCETYSPNGRYTEWNVESAPLIYPPMAVLKQVDGGELRWVRMNSRDELPIDALIGGMEDEPIYIARAAHRGSLCPGKYVKSKQCAFIPWGHAEIVKDDFEVLCGYDATWVKSEGGNIPENAFIGGYSEVHHEPLFIGRAWVGRHCVVGKVHLLYKTCYLPYRAREVEKSKYETLVIGNKVHHSESTDSPCYMKMLMQPCI